MPFRGQKSEPIKDFATAKIDDMTLAEV